MRNSSDHLTQMLLSAKPLLSPEDAIFIYLRISGFCIKMACNSLGRHAASSLTSNIKPITVLTTPIKKIILRCDVIPCFKKNRENIETSRIGVSEIRM